MIVWIWLLSVAHGLLFIVTTPQWEGFDEPFHYAYIQHLAEHGQLPVYGKSSLSREITASFRLVPLPAAVNSNLGNRYTAFPDYWKLPAAARAERENALKNIPRAERRIPDESKDACLNYEAQHPPLYYLLGAGVYRLFSGGDLPTLVLALRLFSLLIGSLTVIAAWRAARFFHSGPRWIFGVPLLIVLLPMFFSTVARISNDSLGVTLFSFLALLVLGYLDSGGSRRQAFYIGVVAGLGLLTKAYFLAALPAVAVIFMAPAIKQRTILRAIGHLICALFPALVIGGWWYARNYLLYANLSGLFTMAQTGPIALSEQLKLATQVPWLTGINIIFREQLWTGNSSFVSLSRMVYTFGYALAGVAVLGLVKDWVRRRSSAYQWPMAVLFGFFVLGMMYQILQAFIASRQLITGGWYLYAVIIPEVLLLSLGVEALLWRRAKALSPTILVALAGVLNLLGNFCKAIPYYAGFIIPRFHLRDFFEMYSPDHFPQVVERLAINKPAFVTPFVIGAVMMCYVILLLLVLGLWFSRRSWSARVAAAPELS